MREREKGRKGNRMKQKNVSEEMLYRGERERRKKERKKRMKEKKKKKENQIE